MPADQEQMIQTLRSVSMFATTSDATLDSIVPLLVPLHVQSGDMIFAKGDPGDALYIIVEGRMRVHDGELTLDMLGRGAVFGEMSVLDPEPRSATVTAEVPSTLLCLQRQDFLASMQENSDVLQGVVHVLCSRLRARMLERHEDFVYMQQFTQVTQAAGAVEAGMFEPESLDNVALRTDELGQLARVFQRMAREVYARELRLRRQVQDLRIEIDQIKQQRRVDEITDTDYFRELQQKATTLRNQVSGQEET